MDTLRDKPEHHIDDGATGIKLSAIEISMQKLTKKIFELELLDAIANETVAELRTKENEAIEEIRKLDQLQYERWKSRDEFCEKIWKFSAEHDLCALFNQYLDMPKSVPRKLVAFDKSQHPSVLKARSEVKELKNQLLDKSVAYQNLEEKVMQAKIQLQITKSYSQEDAEIIGLKTDIDKYQEKYYDLEAKIATLELNFVDWQHNPSNPVADRKRPFVTASELIAQQDTKDTIKRSRFSVKRESEISRKLADTRGPVRHS